MSLRAAVDDKVVILSKYAARSFLVHINNINEAIQFTVYSERENGALPFLAQKDNAQHQTC